MMDKMFESLMHGSESEQVTWRMEWEKASDAQRELFAIVDAIPTVRFIARQVLEGGLKRMRKSIDIDKVYVNTEDLPGDNERRPSGALSEVLFYCLDNNVVPGYVLGGDGVFYLPDTLNDQFKVADFSIFDVEDVITDTLQKLEKNLHAELEKFWAAPAKSASSEKPVLTNKEAFQQAYALVLTAELSLTAMAGYLDYNLARRFAYLLKSENGLGAYNVVLSPQYDYLAGLGPSFILDNAERANSEMKLVNESTSYIMHTPENGFEYFEKNLELHDKLRVRLSLPDSRISYPKSMQSVFSYCVDAHLKGQLETVSTLLRDRGDHDQPLSTLLQNNQNLHVLRYGISTRFSLLWAALKRNEWPLWLRKSNNSVQERFAKLEDSMGQYEVEYQQAFDVSFSFKDYVLRTFSEWSMRTLGEDLDPDAIEVHSLYKVPVGGRTIEQEDTRTLTEFIIFGLHDTGYRAEISISGTSPGSRLSSVVLEQWLSQRNMRTQFVLDIPAGASPEFQQAYRNYLYSKMEVALFIARHSGSYNDAEAKIIERALAGDPSVLVRGIKLKDQAPALKDVLVFSVREHQGYLVFAKTPGGKFEFLKFFQGYDLNKWFEAALSADRDYAASLISPEYLQGAGKLQGTNREHLRYTYVMDARLADLFLKAETPLSDYVIFAYRAEVALHKTIAPVGYRYLGVEGRKRYARLNTELKAFSTVDTRENGFPFFERFTYEEVKKTIESVLQSRGRYVEVDPDRIFVQTDDFRKSVTELLIEGLAFEASHPAYAAKNDPIYFLTGGHPAIDELDIRDLSSISKTFRPGDKYTAMLKKEYLDKKHPDYAFKRAVHAKKVRCEMHYDALSDYVDGRLSLEFLGGVQRIIDSLKESGGYNPVSNSVSEGDEGLYKLNLGQLGLTTANDRTVEGVYIFRLKIGLGFHDLLYTPEAPDRISFRPIQEFIPSIRHRFGPFRNYYIDRILLVDQKVINDYFDNLVATVDTRPPIKTQHRAKLLDLYTFHDERVRRVLSDIDERTTSLKEVIAGLIYDNLIKAASLISIAVPPIGTVVTAIQMMKSIYDGAQAHKRGNYSAAQGHIKDALIGLFTLGKAGAAGQEAKKVTNAQRSFLSLFEDARSVAQFVTEISGQKTADQVLIDFFKDLMKDLQSSPSKTTVR